MGTAQNREGQTLSERDRNLSHFRTWSGLLARKNRTTGSNGTGFSDTKWIYFFIGNFQFRSTETMWMGNKIQNCFSALRRRDSSKFYKDLILDLIWGMNRLFKKIYRMKKILLLLLLLLLYVSNSRIKISPRYVTKWERGSL